MELSTKEVIEWHRRYCEVTPCLAISGDLSENRTRAIAQLEDWAAQGITDIVDVRGEWTDEALVAQVAPQIRYHYLGTHDDGTSQDLNWLETGIAAMQEALSYTMPS